MLRLDWNIVFTIINLLILFLLLKRFLFKPVNTILEKRQAEAESRFKQADEKEAKANESQAKYESLLQDAKKEQEKMVAEARTQAASEYGRIVEEARQQADGIVETAKTNAEKEKDSILRQADSEIKDMVLAAAAKMVGASKSTENDSQLYDKFIQNADGQDTV